MTGPRSFVEASHSTGCTMIRNAACLALVAINIVAVADIMRAASTHLTTYLAASAADAASPTFVR